LKRLYIAAGAIILGFILSAIVAAQPAQSVLVNGDFEQGCTNRDGAPEVCIAVGWDYAWLPTDRWCPSPCKRPEFTIEKIIIYDGEMAQRWFATFASSFGVIHQSVAVEAGQWYEFACQVYVISEPDGQNAAFVGINPWNSGVFDRTMLWGQQQPWGQYRQWHRVSVTAQAWGDKVRVAVGSNNNWATKNNAVYVDNCTIRRVDVGSVTPQPTYTPYPTPELCPTCTPGDECDYERIKSDVATVIAEWDRR